MRPSTFFPEVRTHLKRRPRPLALALIAFGLVACGDDDPTSPPPPAAPDVSGLVTADGVGLAGVTVDLQSRRVITTTDATGRFEFSGVAAGAHTLTVSDLPATVFCSEKTFSVDFVTGTPSTQDFSCTEMPEMAQLVGNWDFTLTNTANTCEAIAAPFTLTAAVSINATTATDLDILFPSPALPITGPYAAGMFNGITSGFDLGGGQTATESWATDFVFNNDNPEAAGTVHVDVTDAAQTVLCTRDFDATGSLNAS